MNSFSEAIYFTYDAAINPDLWPEALSKIGALFDAEGAVVIFYKNCAPADFIFSGNLTHAVRVYMDEEWWRQDIHAQRAIESHLTSGDVFSDFTIATKQEIETLPIYVDFFRRVGFGWRMSTVMLPDLDMLVALSLPRAKAKGPFTAEEMATLQAIGRHAEQALRISLRIANLEARETVLIAALDAMEVGIYGLAADQTLVLANLAAREQIPNHFTTDEGRLVPVGKEDRGRFQALTTAAHISMADTTPPQSCALTGLNGQRIIVTALPVTDLGRERIGLDAGTSTLLIAQPVERQHMVDPTALRDVFGLSLGEARLAALIGGGLPVREAAGKLGITEGTARIVLKRVFRKLGVNRQAELVLQISSLCGR